MFASGNASKSFRSPSLGAKEQAPKQNRGHKSIAHNGKGSSSKSIDSFPEEDQDLCTQTNIVNTKMQISKDSLLKFRLNEDSAKKFIAICDAEETSASAVLRRFVEDYVIQHTSTKLGLSVEVTLGAPYGHGYDSESEYAISAKLMGDESLLEEREIPFLLPDFAKDGKEFFRVDSFAHHRVYFPNCRNAKGRLLGAKLIKNEWQGAIFLYDPHTFGNPQSHFEEIKTALERNIFNAVTQYIQSLNQPEQPDETQA